MERSKKVLEPLETQGSGAIQEVFRSRSDRPAARVAPRLRLLPRCEKAG